jgi:glycosyltransferase involved in cell wall biosynthesis
VKIGFDAKRLFLNNTGLGNYSRTLVRNLQKFYPNNQYYLFTPVVIKNKETKFFIDNPNFQIIRPKRISLYWRQWGMVNEINRLGLDIFHGLSHEIPLRLTNKSTKYIVTVHDLIFELFPSYYPYLDRTLYSYKYKNSCKNADHIIAISHNTANDIIKRWGMREDKITTIYQSCNQNILSEIDPVTEKKHFLYVGSITERKRLTDVILALKLLPENKRKPLVVIGSGDDYKEKVIQIIEDLNLSSWVNFIGQIDNSKLLSYYDAAIALIYPSTYEGFGIPIIEAAFRKIPVITSTTSSMPEAGGPYSFYIEPGDTHKIFEHLSFILDKPSDTAARTELTFQFVSKTFDPFKLSEELMFQYKTL